MADDPQRTRHQRDCDQAAAMVALGTKTDYAKDVTFNVLALAWLINRESRIRLPILEVADAIEELVQWGVSVDAIVPFMALAAAVPTQR